MDSAPRRRGRLNFFDASLLPARAAADRRRWALRGLSILALAAALAVTLRFDVLLMRWRYEVFPNGPEGLLKQVFYGFRDFGQVMPIFVAILIVLRIDLRRWTIVTLILVAQVIAGIGYNTGKLTIARYRPHPAIEQVGHLANMQPGQAWLGFSPGNTDVDLQSFPSGHSAGAFAFAGIMAWFYPRLSGIFWFLAVGCAFSRYVDAAHWLSDAMVGATIGYLGAWLALRPHFWVPPSWIGRKKKSSPL